MTTLVQAFDRFALRILPSELTDATFLQFRALARYERLARDQSLGLDHDTAHILFVVDGATKLVAHASHSRDQIVAFHFSGEVYTVPEQDRYSYSACALRDCEILTFDAGEFLTLAAGDAAIMRHLLDRTTLSLRRCREKTIALGRLSAAERIAIFLLSMAERIGIENDGQMALDLPMSRRDIAESLGLTIETVSRQLSALKAQGAIETVGRGGIVLRDPAALQEGAGFLREAA